MGIRADAEDRIDGRSLIATKAAVRRVQRTVAR